MNSTDAIDNILNKEDTIKIEIQDRDIKQEPEPIVQNEEHTTKSTWDNLEDISVETLNEIQELYTGPYLEEYSKYINKMFPQIKDTDTDSRIKLFSNVLSNTKIPNNITKV